MQGEHLTIQLLRAATQLLVTRHMLLALPAQWMSSPSRKQECSVSPSLDLIVSVFGVNHWVRINFSIMKNPFKISLVLVLPKMCTMVAPEGQKMSKCQRSLEIAFCNLNLGIWSKPRNRLQN